MLKRYLGDGWPLVWGLALAQLTSWGTVYYGFSLFVVPMEAELGWSRAAMNGALSVGLLSAGLWAYPIGAWIDRRGGRLPMTLGSLAGILLLAAWSRIDAVWMLYAVWVGLGFMLAANLYEPAFAVITRRFPDDAKTRITALTLIGGFASTVFIPLGQLFIERLGWRDALLALAACNLAISLPIHAFLLRGADSAPGPSAAASAPADDSPTALRAALRTPEFWGLAAAFTAYYATFSALTFHIIPLLTERGLPTTTIVGAIAAIGPAQVLGRIALLALRRDLSSRRAGRLAMLTFPLSVGLLAALPESVAALFGFAVLYGCANGIVTIVRGTVWPELRGSAGYGAINGALTLPTNVARAAAPFGAALVWQVGGYGAVLQAILAGSVVAALGFWYATRRRGAPPS